MTVLQSDSSVSIVASPDVDPSIAWDEVIQQLHAAVCEDNYAKFRSALYQIQPFFKQQLDQLAEAFAETDDCQSRQVWISEMLEDAFLKAYQQFGQWDPQQQPFLNWFQEFLPH